MMTIPCEFLFRLRDPVDWNDLLYAYHRQIIDITTLTAYVSRALGEVAFDNDAAIPDGLPEKPEQLKPFLDRAAGDVYPTDERSKKWAMILAAFVNEFEVGDKLTAIDDIYSSFDYPEELAGMVRYMPMLGPDLGSKEANENRMLESLSDLSKSIVYPVKPQGT